MGKTLKSLKYVTLEAFVNKSAMMERKEVMLRRRKEFHEGVLESYISEENDEEERLVCKALHWQARLINGLKKRIKKEMKNDPSIRGIEEMSCNYCKLGIFYQNMTNIMRELNNYRKEHRRTYKGNKSLVETLNGLNRCVAWKESRVRMQVKRINSK